ncbi:TPA: hypothetical protein ACH3X2_005637 [Trebouxia sp. C0005]
MQPAHQDKQSDACQESEAARDKTALPGRGFQRERKSPIREATPSRSSREDARGPSSSHRSGSRRSYSPSEHRRDHRRVLEGRPTTHRDSHSQDNRPYRQPSSRYSLESSPRHDRDRRSRDKSSPPRPSAGQSRHRLSQADDRQDQPSARQHPPGETSAAATTNVSQKVPASQQSQGQPAPDSSAQQHQVEQDSDPAQQPASFHSGLQNIKQVADVSVPSSQGAPAMPAARHFPSTAALPPPPSRPPTPPAGLLGVSSGAHSINQEACSRFDDPSQGLPTVTLQGSLVPFFSYPSPKAAPHLSARPSQHIPIITSATPPQSYRPSPGLLFRKLDALRALYTRGLLPPVPKVKALDNVVKCRLILPPELPESWSAWNAAHPKAEASEESIKQKELAKHRTAAVLKREQDRAAKGNTLDKITEKFKEGPLLLLRRYYKTSVRLQIVTRHALRRQGTATGVARATLSDYTAMSDYTASTTARKP